LNALAGEREALECTLLGDVVDLRARLKAVRRRRREEVVDE
jgi:hypothetical protein